MGRKNVVKTYEIWNGVDLTTDPTSSHTDTINLDKASIFVEWSGSSPSGTLVVQGTNDDPSASAAPTWYEIEMGGTISISGNSGSHSLVFTELPFAAIRLNYTNSSGTGTISATITAKTIGA